MRGELGHERVTVCAGRPRRRRGAGPVAALRGARGAAGPLQHRSRPCCPTGRARCRARCAWRPTTSSARPATPTGWPPSSTPRSGGAATWRSSTARASGRRRARSTRDDVDFMTEPFADAERFRASIANYEYAGGPRTLAGADPAHELNPTPTLILYGPEDHVIPRDFPQRMEVAFPERAGPFVVQGAGHFLQWERADVLNGALRWLRRAPEASVSTRPGGGGLPGGGPRAHPSRSPSRRVEASVTSAASGWPAARPRRTRLPISVIESTSASSAVLRRARARARRPAARSRSPRGRR